LSGPQKEKMTMKFKRIQDTMCWTIGVMIAALYLPAAAHNGEITLALPVDGIVIDGDLSDWPEGLKEYAIGRAEYGVAPTDTADYNGSFRIGYNVEENALYVAVEVEDQSTVISPAGEGNWDTQDGCEIYLDLGHALGGSAMQFAVYGDSPDLSNAEDKIGPDAVGFKRAVGGHWYEWRFDAGKLSEGKVRLGPNTVLALDVVATDKDEDESFSWMSWGRGTAKSGAAQGRGDVILVEHYTAVGTVAGRVTVDGGDEPYNGLAIDIYQGDQLAGSAHTDSVGQYEALLPPGEYTFKPGGRQGVEAFEINGIAVDSGQPSVTDFSVVSRPFIARLAFQVAAERMAGFKAAYKEVLEAVLVKHGLVPSKRYGVPAPEGVFSLYYEMNVLAEMQEKKTALEADSTWTAALQEVGDRLGMEPAEGSLLYHLEFISMLAGPGQTVAAGAGTEVVAGAGVRTAAGSDQTATGDWRTWQDGVAGAEINALLRDGEGRLWIGTNGLGLGFYDGAYFTTFTTDDGLAHNWVNALLQDSEGRLWIGTDGGGVSRYDGKGFTTFTTDDGLANDVVKALLQDTQGRIWIGTGGGGVSLYDGEGFTTLTTQDGLSSDWIGALLEDSEGRFWIGTEEGGVSLYDGERFTIMNIRDGLGHNWVSALLQDSEGRVWVGTLGGVSFYDGERFTTLNTRDGLGHNWVGALLQDGDGHLWIGTEGGGVSRYAGQDLTTFTTETGLAHNAVAALALDKQGTIWVGTEGGVNLYK